MSLPETAEARARTGESQNFKADGRCLGFRDKEVQGTCLGMRDKEVKGYMSRNA